MLMFLSGSNVELVSKIAPEIEVAPDKWLHMQTYRHKGHCCGPRAKDGRGRLRPNARGDPYAFPYTGTTAPRVTRLSGDARNRIVAATSSTFGQAAWSALGIA